MKYVVTGGAGFIGSHLVDLLLKNNYDVIILDNFSTGRLENIQHVKNQIKIVECDISEDGQYFIIRAMITDLNGIDDNQTPARSQDAGHFRHHAAAYLSR